MATSCRRSPAEPHSDMPARDGNCGVDRRALAHVLVALGDPAGRALISPRSRTRLEQPFADACARTARSVPAIAERTPGAAPRRLRRDRAGQAGQPRAELFLRHRSDPALRPGNVLPRPRPGRPVEEAAVRVARRVGRAAAGARRRRLCPAGRPAAAPVARSHADRAPGRCRRIGYYESPPRCHGSAPRSSARPRSGGRQGARQPVPRCHPPVRVAARAGLTARSARSAT